MIQFNSSLISLQTIDDDILDAKGVELSILRTDLNHEFISGNKLFKLKYNLQEAQRQSKNSLLTFGGAFSNHIAATAAAGKEYGFKTIGIIRGEEYAKLNPTLKLANEMGMDLFYVSRALYRDKEALMNYVRGKFSSIDYYSIPEGGSNHLGVKGCEEIRGLVNSPFDIITTACGTGATMAGIVKSLKNDEKAIGFQVLKAENYIVEEVCKWTESRLDNSWNINEDYHFGGYAKRKPALVNFVDSFWKKHNIPLDYVYTGKMLYGIYDLIEKGEFAKGTRIVAVHTGGLQGNAGFVN